MENKVKCHGAAAQRSRELQPSAQHRSRCLRECTNILEGTYRRPGKRRATLALHQSQGQAACQRRHPLLCEATRQTQWGAHLFFFRVFLREPKRSLFVRRGYHDTCGHRSHEAASSPVVVCTKQNGGDHYPGTEAEAAATIRRAQ